MSSSILETEISEKITEMGPPIRHSSICFVSLLLTENTHSLVGCVYYILYFVCLKEGTAETRKNIFISLQKPFLFLR